MKKFLLSVLTAFVILSCSSDDNSSGSNPNLVSAPEAKIEYNDSNFGMYKGVFVGSSGVIKVNINNDETISAILTIDGTAKTFTTSETVTLDQEISGLTFTNGNDSFDFNVSASGLNPYISDLTVEGHPFSNIEIIKEYSDAQVMCYTGTYNGDDSGVFNLIKIENSLYGLAKANDAENTLFIEGSIDDNENISGIFEGGVFTGELNGNSMSGQWVNQSQESGNWSGNRKL